MPDLGKGVLEDDAYGRLVVNAENGRHEGRFRARDKSQQGNAASRLDAGLRFADSRSIPANITTSGTLSGRHGDARIAGRQPGRYLRRYDARPTVDVSPRPCAPRDSRVPPGACDPPGGPPGLSPFRRRALPGARHEGPGPRPAHTLPAAGHIGPQPGAPVPTLPGTVLLDGRALRSNYLTLIGRRRAGFAA